MRLSIQFFGDIPTSYAFNSWKEAEAACTTALGQQKSSKAYYRRAKARKMLGRIDEAEQGINEPMSPCTILIALLHVRFACHPSVSVVKR